MLSVVLWWLWMGVLGLVALPLTYRFFRWLPGRGYAFARPLGLLLTSYVLWLGASLGLLRNSLGGALFSIAFVAILSFVFYRRRRSEDDPGLWTWLRANGRMVLAVELLFAGALTLWSLLRAYSPDLMTAGGEKFMEIMFLNSIGRSEYFPPLDAWLSGYAISYYYFGYVMMAMLNRLAGLPAHLTFNIGLASLFALTCTGAFGLVYNLVKAAEQRRKANRVAPEQRPEEKPPRSASPIAWGLLGATLVAVMGNLEGFLEVLWSARLFPAAFWRWLDIREINQLFPEGGAPSLMPTRSGWWFWRASRVIHDLDPSGNTMGVQPIDEFPGFSFLLGDMHPHVLALPFVLLVLALALNLILMGRGQKDTGQVGEGSPDPSGLALWWEPVKQLPILVPLCLGALAFLNTWDFPIYWLMYMVVYGLSRWPHYRRIDGAYLRDVGVTGIAIVVLGALLYLPFYVGFRSQAGGILPTLYVGTRFRQYFVMFGPFLVAIAGLLVMLVKQVKKAVSARRLVRGWLGWTAAFVLLPLGVMFLIGFIMVLTPQGREFLDSIRRVPEVYEIVGDEAWLPLLGRLLQVKLRTWVMPLVVAAMAGLAVVLVQRSAPKEQDESWELLPSVRFVLVCAAIGLLLTLSVEFFYLIDVFRVRANTIFKFYFQAWVLMGIASAFGVYWLSRQRGWLRSVFLVAFWLLFGMAMVYPVLGNISRAGSFDHAPNLDGSAYLANGQADDYAAIAWLNESVKGAPVLLEMPAVKGASYVYEGRVSALTGLPTLLGWSGHENQWRGNYDIQGIREPDIETIYNSLDPRQVLTLIDEYDIVYVYVGPLERSEYDPRALEKFEQIMDAVYQNNGVTIYRIRE